MIAWKLYNLDNPNEVATDYFNLKFGEPGIGSKDLVRLEWTPIPPAEAVNGPFKISPQYL